MAVDAIQTSLSAMKSTVEQLREVAQDIAVDSVAINQPNANADLPPPQQVIEINATANRQPAQARDAGSSIDQRAENAVRLVELGHQAKAISKTLQTADEMLGTIINSKA